VFYILYHLTGKKENVVRQIYKNLKLNIDISILQSVSIKTIGGYNTFEDIWSGDFLGVEERK